jgi:thromboxane-A synthase
LEPSHSFGFFLIVKDTACSSSSVLMHKYIKNDEIVNNLLLFLLAGTDTISATLTYCTYTLAKYPIEQERVYENIFNQSFNLDCIKSMDYLDMFIRETLRIYPVSITAMSRQCTQDCTVLNYTIRRGNDFTYVCSGISFASSLGDGIQPDVYTIHHDIRLWGPVDPEKFYPDRFRTKRHPMAWLPFGAGPRTCVGIKLALLEIKLVLIALLRLYQIELESDNDKPLIIKESFVLAPNELRIRLKQRTIT